jgi:hypothetical protein
MNMRSWRNRQTRTVEGRVRKGMGSSPFDRTKKISIAFAILIFFSFQEKGLELERAACVKKTARLLFLASWSEPRRWRRTAGASGASSRVSPFDRTQDILLISDCIIYIVDL